MNRRGTRFLITIALTVPALLANGCSKSSSDRTTAPPAGQMAENGHEHDGEGHSAADMEIAQVGLAKLSPEDRASAEKQRVCPVTGKLLGSMGPPKKVDVKGQQVWMCCDGCREELLAKPEEYLAKLKQE